MSEGIYDRKDGKVVGGRGVRDTVTYSTRVDRDRHGPWLGAKANLPGNNYFYENQTEISKHRSERVQFYVSDIIYKQSRY